MNSGIEVSFGQFFNGIFLILFGVFSVIFYFKVIRPKQVVVWKLDEYKKFSVKSKVWWQRIHDIGVLIGSIFFIIVGILSLASDFYKLICRDD